MNPNVKKTLWGMLLGLLGNVVGFLTYGLVLSSLKNISFTYFIDNMFLKTEVFRSQIITGALLVNVLIFYIFMKQGKDNLSKGILITILLSVIAIIYYF